VRKSFSPTMLMPFREMASEAALVLLSSDIKADSTYIPAKKPDSRRWHARTICGEFEILTTGHKWYDTRAKKGGGGAIDLAMHILGLSFVDAVKHLNGKVPPRALNKVAMKSL
jgi:hypothetical protein